MFEFLTYTYESLKSYFYNNKISIYDIHPITIYC